MCLPSTLLTKHLILECSPFSCIHFIWSVKPILIRFLFLYRREARTTFTAFLVPSVKLFAFQRQQQQPHAPSQRPNLGPEMADVFTTLFLGMSIGICVGAILSSKKWRRKLKIDKLFDSGKQAGANNEVKEKDKTSDIEDEMEEVV